MPQNPSILLVTAFLLGIAASSPPTISRANSLIARQKVERIQTESMKPGETITLTEDELNSYLQYDYAPQIPDGVRDLRVRLLKDVGVAHTYLDFAKLQRASGGSFSSLWAALFSGERELIATCRYTSANGYATVELESAQLDGTTLSGPILEWLVANVVAGELPGFEFGKPQPLPMNLHEIRVEPGRAVVVSK